MIDFPNSVSSKLPRIGQSIFSIMSKMAQEEGAINLSQGFPDFAVSEDLIKNVNERMLAGFNQYAPHEGVLELRQAIADKIDFSYGRKYDPYEEITITSGATQAIFTAITALVREGQEVILFTPAYDSYEPAIELNGGSPIYVQLKAPGFRIDWDEVKKLVNRKTRMIIINTPHNPTGMCMSSEDMLELAKITMNSDIIVLSDEVYEQMVFDKNEHQSVARYKNLAERSLIVASFGKTFHATGWKVGYIYGPQKIMKEVRKIHQIIVFSVNTAVQYALADYIRDPETYNSLYLFYQKKRDYFLNLIKDSRFKFIPAQGSYFQLLSYQGISRKKEVEFTKELTKKHKLATIPISVFYHQSVENQMIRVCFAKSEETLEKAADILNKI